MKYAHIISIGFTLTEVFAESVFLNKKEAIKALKENGFKFSKNDECYINTKYSLTQCAKIEKIELNKINL